MNTYTLNVHFLSPALIGSGEGFGAIIDQDIVFDSVGMPYIPAKRIKGCLLDAAKDVKDMFSISKINDLSIDLSLFGEQGSPSPGPVYFSNLTMNDYELNKSWLAYFIQTEEYTDFLSKDLILDTFTEIRHQTKIDPDSGIAFDHSLRTLRVLKKGVSFYGDVHIPYAYEDALLPSLLLACMNFRAMGTGRNRGFGELTCTLLKGKKILSIANKLEAICTQ